MTFRALLMVPIQVVRSPRDLIDAARASLMLRKVIHDMREVPTGSLVSLESGTDAYTGTRNLPRETATQARRWARAVHRAQKFGPYRGACLARALTLHRLLVAHGISGSRVCVGVGGGATADFQAHAWVELHGVVFGDGGDVAYRWSRLGSAAPAMSKSGAA